MCFSCFFFRVELKLSILCKLDQFIQFCTKCNIVQSYCIEMKSVSHFQFPFLEKSCFFKVDSKLINFLLLFSSRIFISAVIFQFVSKEFFFFSSSLSSLDRYRNSNNNKNNKNNSNNIVCAPEKLVRFDETKNQQYCCARVTTPHLEAEPFAEANKRTVIRLVKKCSRVPYNSLRASDKNNHKIYCG